MNAQSSFSELVRLGDGRKRVVWVESVLADQELTRDSRAFEHQAVFVFERVDPDEARNLAQLTVALQKTNRFDSQLGPIGSALA